MVVIKRKKFQDVVASLDGRDLTIRVLSLTRSHVMLGFDGPHRVSRIESEKRDRIKSHLAAPPVTIGGFCIQRCTLCGDVLQEFDLQELKPGEVAPGGLAVGRFYEFSQDGDTRLLEAYKQSFRFESHIILPANCCIFGA